MRALALAALLLPALASAQGTVSFSTDPVVQGQPVTLRFSEPADSVMLTYRPNSDLASTDAVALGGATAYEWTPREAGLVRITTPGGVAQSVGVRFTGLPVSGLLVLVVAGLVLFGGAAFALFTLLGGPEEAAADVEHWPDT